MLHRAFLIAIVVSVGMAACTTTRAASSPMRQVLFVCEHGNVKSLMAASYFNELAQARGLTVRAVSRGVTPDSDSVPDFLKTQLTAEGFDVSEFRPKALSNADIVGSDRVVAISTSLPPGDTIDSSKVEQWDDVPAASADYARARESIKAHVQDLINRLSKN